MLDVLRHARVLHYSAVALSIGLIAIFSQTNPVAGVYAQARMELAVLEAFLGRSTTASASPDFDPTRMQEARESITTRVHEHVHWVLSRNLTMALGRDVDPKLSLRWEVPIAHQAQLPLDSDLIEIRSRFAAIPIVVEQPDLAELAWLLTSQVPAKDLSGIQNLTIGLAHDGSLEEHVRRVGFESAEEGVKSKLTLSYTDASGRRQRIETALVARITRMPDLNQRAAFHNSFPELERVLHLVEFETPEQANLTLAEKQREARSGILRGLSSSLPFRMGALLAMPLLLLLLLAHVRHLLDSLPGIAPPEIRQIGWFPLFSDRNSRSFEVLTLIVLPGAGPLTWIASRYLAKIAMPIEDVLLYSAASIVCLLIGASIRSELEELRACIAEGPTAEAGTNESGG